MRPITRPLLRSTARQRVAETVVTLVALAALWLLSLTPQWRQLEFKTFDAYTQVAAAGAGATPIVLVAIDEPSFRELGMQWPFPRGKHAELVDRLAADGARVIAFDMLFSERTTAVEDERLAAAIRNAGNVVLARTRELSETATSREWTPVEPLPVLLAASARTGEVGVDPDADFVVRMTPAAPDAFARQIARLASRDKLDEPGGGATTLIRYAGPHGTFPTVHYYQAVTPGLLPAGFFRDKVVLVGLDVHASPELTRKQADLYNSPFLDTQGGVMPGVEIHANVVANLLEGRSVVPASTTAQVFLVVALVAMVGLVGLRRSPASAAAVLIGAGLATVLLTDALFLYRGVYLSPLLAVTAGAMAFVVQTSVGFLTERRRAQETRRAFAQYVPSEVVNRLVEQPELLELGGEERELTLLFADLANFTAMSERLAPREVVAVLGKYFDAMSTVIYRHGGTVDKYIGDGIMAFWGAPLPDERHAERALQAAVDMQRVFDKVARRLVGKGNAAIAMRIGIHTGSVIVGNVGSRARFAYTAIGDAVNLASRLEGANKAYGTRILLSDATARQLPTRVRLRPVDSVVVKGRSDSVKVFTPCEDAQVVDLSRAAIEAFVARAWDSSLALWQEILARHPDDGVAQAFILRIASLRDVATPVDWTGATALDKL